MPTISGRTSIASGASVVNLLAGSQYEFAPFDGKIEIGMFADKNLVSVAVFAGPDTLAEPGSFCPFGAAEATPKYPDDYHWIDDVNHGDRLKISASNGNAATTILNWVLRVTPE